MGEFAEAAALWTDDVIPFDAGAEAHAEWQAWSTPGEDGTKLDLARCLAIARELLPADAVICNGAGNFSGWWHRYWPYAGFPSQLAPTSGAMGYGVPAAVAAKLRLSERMVVAVAGDGDFLMNGQELATAEQYGLDLLVIVVDNSSYGTIRMHQEREFPGRVSATDLANPDFAALARAFGGWAARVERTEEFAPALKDALGRSGIRLLHLVSDIERLNAAGSTVSGLRQRAK
jgi:acetolactate synthase-1/2/3 large subunit